MNINDAPLNKAHQLERKAETFFRQGKFEECIECHKRAVALFTESLKLTKNPTALESIRLQKNWNEQQIKSLEHKKIYHENVQKAKQKSKVRTFSTDSDSLETRIFRTMETHDSLIFTLEHRGNDENDEIDNKDSNNQITGNKHPKDDQIVIEELKTLSGQLKESIYSLLNQIEAKNQKIDTLEARVKELEDDKLKSEGNRIKSAETVSSVEDPMSKLGSTFNDDLNLTSLPKLELNFSNLPS